MKDNRKQIKEQIKFCNELMKRLVKLVEKNADKESTYTYCGMANCSQVSNDIIRLRRELNTLNKLLSRPNGED